MNEATNSRMAMLIDGDNAQPKLIELILSESSKYGKVTIRRVYGDWTQQSMNGWKNVLNENAISPIQKFSYTTGKNSTDSALIIDAMDILHSKLVDGFCIVSSDSDYTGLAKRIREEGIFVLGIGEQKTPKAFVHSCDNFTFCETLLAEEEAEKSPGTKQKIKYTVLNKSANKHDHTILNRAFNMVVGDNETAYLSEIGLGLRKLDPSFDHRTYGFKSLADLFRSLDKEFEVLTNDANGMKVYMVKKK
ncbi:MAG: NYN domain-containing protein [Chitinophagaceae bacterium]|jgi:uncharacterized LabA/DUF88 family protein|nr:NYN domain-containing protein [Chitinophagaceae bacterium]